MVLPELKGMLSDFCQLDSDWGFFAPPDLYDFGEFSGLCPYVQEASTGTTHFCLIEHQEFPSLYRSLRSSAKRPHFIRGKIRDVDKGGGPASSEPSWSSKYEKRSPVSPLS